MDDISEGKPEWVRRALEDLPPVVARNRLAECYLAARAERLERDTNRQQSAVVEFAAICMGYLHRHLRYIGTVHPMYRAGEDELKQNFQLCCLQLLDREQPYVDTEKACVGTQIHHYIVWQIHKLARGMGDILGIHAHGSDVLDGLADTLAAGDQDDGDEILRKLESAQLETLIEKTYGKTVRAWLHGRANGYSQREMQDRLVLTASDALRMERLMQRFLVEHSKRRGG